ncbi:hypothetical protein [Vibrio rotiferianus]|uniref:hypothetical protein n=1 Tax=Vibrio rotiferianus TaxID=190895 RepID=UPI0005F0B77A|nr:hypothetical protein [Vibrio rotiferianus]
MKKLVAVSAIAVFSLVGCGGGGGGSASSGSTNTKSDTFAHNGLYANPQDQVLMLVDSNRTQYPVIVGDFYSNAIIAGHKVTTTKDSLTITGLSYVDTSVNLSDSTLKAEAGFNSQGVVLTATVDGKLTSYSLQKSPDSKALADLVGSYTNPNDGTVWSVDAAGNLSVNGMCQMYGKLTRNGAYFDLKHVEVSNCADPDFNGVYQGVVATASYAGGEYLSGVLNNEGFTLWGSAPLQ